MSEKADFFEKKLTNTRSFKRKQASSTTWILIIVAILLVVGGGYGAYRLFFSEVKLEDPQETISTFSLDQEVVLSGNLQANGDILTHTHTIIDERYGTLALRSETIQLANYFGPVRLTGIVEKFYQGEPIIKVIAIVSLEDEPGEGQQDIVLNESSGEYLLEAGIHFLPAFFEEYVLLNEGDNGQVLIQDLDTGEEIAISYFRCNASNPDRNCVGLESTFSSHAERSFVTANGDAYYKLSEVNSWFVNNGDWRGIFINDVPEDTVMKLKDLMVFANKKVIKDWINFAAPRICQNNDEKLQKITSSDIVLKQGGLVATIKGEGITNTIECSIQIDFSLPDKGKLLELKVGDSITSIEVDTSENEEVENLDQGQSTGAESSSEVTQSVTPVEWDENAEQFPLNSEKGLIYNSKRGGYSLKFPSANISYAVSSVKENFGQTGLSCSYVINVIKYADKENLETSPAIRIYECQSTGNIEKPTNRFVLINTSLEKTFLVQVNDPSWVDFANALSIQALEE